MRTGVRVADAMTKSPVKISPDISVAECAKEMVDRGVGGLIVQEGETSLGIVTEKDVVDKVVAQKRDIEITKVRDIMSTKLIGISPEKDLYDAVVLMRDDNIRRLPVMHDGKVVGLLTEKDVLKIEPQLIDYIIEKLRVREEEEKAAFLKSRE